MLKSTGSEWGKRRLVDRAVFSGILLLAVVSCIAGQTFINSAGAPHAKRQGRTQEPKMVIDTLRMDSGCSTLLLKETFSETFARTRPTGQGNFFAVVTGLLRDTSEAVCSYSVYLSVNAETLLVKSSSATDSGLVSVMAFIK